MNFFCISLGCPKNRVDAERLLGSIPHAEIVEEQSLADVVLINTCAFIAPAIQESVRTILNAVEESNSVAKKPFLIVAGCLNGRFDITELKKEIPEVDLWLVPNELEIWAEQVAQSLRIPINAYPKGRIISTLPSYAWLKIGEGCTHNCSFCTIPSIRGKERSYSTTFLVDEARKATSQGVKEIILVAQDVTAWRDEQKKPDLRPLLEKLMEIDELKRIRLMYLYPTGITNELLHFIADSEKKVLPYFDVPLQHAHTDILKNMGRPFSSDPYIVVEKIRTILPQAALRTSLIVGFPGEEEKHYQKLCDFVEDVRFHNLGVFAYQAEEGTRAAQMPSQVKEEIKELRRDNLMEIQAEISEEILASSLGAQEELLIDSPIEEWQGLYSARTWFQAPEVDGITYVSGENIHVGQIIKAEIVETKEYDLVALA